jgi:spermidine synthase
VAEIDPIAVELAQRYFDFAPPSGVLDGGDGEDGGRLFIEDGRRLLNRLDRRYDAVILDAYAAETLPFHLLSLEAFQAVRRHLEPDGVLLINDRELAGAAASPGLLALIRTLREVFPLVEVYASETGGALDSRFVVASMQSGKLGMATTRPDAVEVTLETGPFRSRPMTARVQSIDDRAGRLLTDAFNPMEWLDAPVAEAAREATRRYLR